MLDKTGPNVNGMPGAHRVCRRQADGSTKVHLYAWRGGPRLTGETSEALRESYEAARASYRPAWKTPRKPRARVPADEKAALNQACRKAYDNAKARATKKGVDFSLDPASIASMLASQRFCCALSSLQFDLSFDGAGRYAYNPFGISIDRIDCQKGYTPRNVRLVLVAINFAINEWGEEVYKRIARAVVARDLLLPHPPHLEERF